VFVIDSKDYFRCFDYYSIAHIRQNYVDTWYDVDNDDGSQKIFKFTPLEQKGDIYVTMEGYYHEVVPGSCITLPPLVKYGIFKNGNLLSPGFIMYYDQFHRNSVIKEDSYSPKDVFEIAISWTWNLNPGNDYTVKLHSAQKDLRIYDN
jgi:hypothetical protein